MQLAAAVHIQQYCSYVPSIKIVNLLPATTAATPSGAIASWPAAKPGTTVEASRAAPYGPIHERPSDQPLR